MNEYDETFQITSRINFLMCNTGALVRLGACGLVPNKCWQIVNLFQSEGVDYNYHIDLSPPIFESHRRAWNTTRNNLFYFRLSNQLKLPRKLPQALKYFLQKKV